MTLPIYLAGASRELERVLPIVQKLDDSKLVHFTYRWWEAVQAHGVGRDHELTVDERRDYALRALAGVHEARLVWCLLPDAPSLGAAIEVGYALHPCKVRFPLLIVTGARARGCIFSALANVEHADDQAGLDWVLVHAQAMKDMGARYET